MAYGDDFITYPPSAQEGADFHQNPQMAGAFSGKNRKNIQICDNFSLTITGWHDSIHPAVHLYIPLGQEKWNRESDDWFGRGPGAAVRRTPKGNAKTLRQKGRAMTMLREARRTAHRRCNPQTTAWRESLRLSNGGAGSVYGRALCLFAVRSR